MSASETPLFEFAYEFTRKIGDELKAGGHSLKQSTGQTSTQSMYLQRMQLSLTT
jgi:hypothetical protein